MRHRLDDDLQILLISPRNSNEAVRHLMAAVGSTLMLTDEGAATYEQHDVPFSIVRLPNSTMSPAERKKSCDKLILPLRSVGSQDLVKKEMDLACLYVHTSGSTGELLSSIVKLFTDGRHCRAP